MKRLVVHIKRRYERLDARSQSFVSLVGWFVILNIALLTGLYLMEPTPDLAPVWLPVYAGDVAGIGLGAPSER